MDGMQYSGQPRVVGSDGVAIGSLVDLDSDSEPTSIIVRLDSDGRLLHIPETQIDVDRSSDQEIVALVPGHELAASPAPGGEQPVQREAVAEMAADSTEHQTIPLSEEQLAVRTRDGERGRVVIRKRVETVGHDEPVELVHDEVDVERVAVNRNLESMPEIREEGETVIVPVVEEVLVVEKQLRLVEEVRITKRQVREHTVVHEDLRREVVDVSAEDTLREVPES